MTELFLDSFAWLEYFEATKKGRIVIEHLDSVDVAYTSPMVLAEITTKTLKTHDGEMAARRVQFIQDHCVVVEHTSSIGVAAGRIHHEMKAQAPGFGMADAFILAAARSKGVRVLTGDPHFKGLVDAEIL